MGILKSLLPEKRNSSSLSNPAKWLIDFLGGGTKSVAGVIVNEKTAMTYSAFFAGVKIISETVAQLPVHLYEQLDERNKRKATHRRLYRILHDEPNPEMTAFIYKETAQSHILVWGNHYANIEWGNDGQVKHLWPLNPAKTRPFRDKKTNELKYEVILPTGENRILGKWEVLHIPGFGWDGLKGISVIGLARESIGLGLAVEEFGARFFGNGAHPGGIVEYPEGLSDQAYERYKKDVRENYEGLSRSHRLMILEEGLKYHQTGIPPEDAQFLQTRRFQIEEVARWLNLPPHFLKDMERATFSNIEQQSLDYVIYSASPWLVRWEQQLKKDLLLDSEKGRYFAKFNVNALLRGDSQARAEFYNRLFQIGVYSPNDIRELEDENPYEGGDTRYVQLNMIPVDESNPKLDDGSNESNELKRSRELRSKRSVAYRAKIASRYKKKLRASAEKLVKREVEAVKNKIDEELIERNIGNLERWLDSFYTDLTEVIRVEIGPVIQAFAEAIADAAINEIDIEEVDNLQRFISEYIDNFAVTQSRENLRKLKKILRKALEDEGFDPLSKLSQRLDYWEENGADTIANKHETKVNGAISSFVFFSAGYALRWIAGAGACDFCLQMDGKIIERGQRFIEKGETLDSDENEPLIVQTNISHPPLHDGCTCGVAPG